MQLHLKFRRIQDPDTVIGPWNVSICFAIAICPVQRYARNVIEFLSLNSIETLQLTARSAIVPDNVSIVLSFNSSIFNYFPWREK